MWRRARTPDRAPGWSRPKLLALLIAGSAGIVASVVGLGLAAYHSVVADDRAERSGTVAVGGSGNEGRADVADQLLPRSDESAARPGPLTTEPFEAISLPAPTRLGPVGVSTGFPRTTEGALAQLAAIDQAVLQSASAPHAQEVIGSWAVPGGPSPESWSGVRAVAELLTAAGLPATGSPELTVAATPEMGLVRGTVTSDDLVACVDFVVSATMTTTARVAAADCQRMVWEDGRWMIGAGPEPAPAPSVWPGTEAALLAGYRMLRDE